MQPGNFGAPFKDLLERACVTKRPPEVSGNADLGGATGIKRPLLLLVSRRGALPRPLEES
jgi:hypothetical protein